MNRRERKQKEKKQRQRERAIAAKLQRSAPADKIVQPQDSPTGAVKGLPAGVTGNTGAPPTKPAHHPWTNSIIIALALLALTLALAVQVASSAGGSAGAKAARAAVDEDGITERLSAHASGLKAEIDEQSSQAIEQGHRRIAESLTRLDGRIGELLSTIERLDVPREKPPAIAREKAVFVVLPSRTRGAASASAQDMWEGIVKPAVGEALYIRTNERTEFVRFIEIEDGPDGASTVRRLKDRARAYECLIVLGHVESTRAKYCVDEFYRRESIPVVLLGPTTPSITKDAVDAGDLLLLRMLPTDDKQVERIADIVRSRPAYTRLVIASDSGNMVYSDYITAQLAEDLTIRDRIVSTVQISPTNVTNADFCRLAQYQPNLVIIVGMSATARIFVQSWEAAMRSPEGSCRVSYDLKNVSALFTDGCASSRFQEFIEARPTEYWNELFVLSPMPPRREASSEGTLFDYSLLGEFATHVARYLLTAAGRNGELNREGVAKQLRELMYKGRTNVGPQDKEAYVNFVPQKGPNVRGDNQEWKWHVYEVNRTLKQLEVDTFDLGGS